ncbi:hypothetical protein [Gracilimonas sp.]|uniref:hypothetical protein n=1 Tax=Gracilimonas sp. TaxID=1974203 RepID=UPI003BACE1F2
MSESRDKISGKLSAISFGIIVYLLLDANFTSEGSFMGGSIKIGNPNYIEYIFLFLFIYYNFRFWQIRRRNFFNPFKFSYHRVYNYEKFKNYVESKTGEVFRKKISNGEKLLGSVWNFKDSNIPAYGNIENNAKHLPHFEFEWPYCKVKVNPISKDKSVGNPFGDLKYMLKVHFFTFSFYYLRANFRYVFVEPDYLSDNLPFWISFTAIGFLLFEYFS